MKTEEFKEWLEERYPNSETTVSNRISNCKKVEKSYEDLDEHFKKDKCSFIIDALTYSTEDERENLPTKHKILIDGNIRTGSATLKQAVNLYVTFRQEFQSGEKIQRSFFDYMGIANREKIHSQFIAWLFSDNCTAISNNDKVELLEKIFKIDNCIKIEKTSTEIKSIDIIISTTNNVLVIENKLKSSKHSNQLERYMDEITKLKEFSGDPLFFYLSLIDEKDVDKEWKKISYSHILLCLKECKLKEESRHRFFIEEYIVCLEQFVHIYNDFCNNPKKYDSVFLDGGKTKDDKLNTFYEDDKLNYIADNQLETIFQKAFLNSLANKIENQKSTITETHGDALIDFIIKDDITVGKREFCTFIQLQKENLKFSFAIKNDYDKSKKRWVEDIIPHMEELKNNNSFGYKKRNSPKSKAYVSISKKIEKYWHMNIGELTSIIETEIENGKELTEQLKQMIGE